MSENRPPVPASFGLLPEPEGRSASFMTSAVVNGSIVALILTLSMYLKPKLVEHHYEQTMLIAPTPEPPPPPKIKITPPKMPDPPKMPEVKLETPKILMPKIEPKPEKVQMEAKVNLPVIKTPQVHVVEAPQPKAALAAMPAQSTAVKPSTAPVHLGQTFGVTPNPNATRPATVAAVGNMYGGNNGPAVAPHGVVGSTGIGNGLKSGSNAGMVGRVGSAGIPGQVAAGPASMGRVASAGIPQQVVATAQPVVQQVRNATNLEVLSKPPVQYTAEARQLKVQGDVVLRVKFTAQGQVQVLGIVRGLGHGLDEEARRVAGGIRFRPATQNGQPVDQTTNITITFQLA